MEVAPPVVIWRRAAPISLAGGAVLAATIWTAAPLARGGDGYLAAFVVRDLLLLAVYLAAIAVVLRTPSQWVGPMIWAVGIGARLFLACLQPLRLSGDLYRYLWDGRLILAGINPYGIAPADPALAVFREWPHWAALGFKDVPTIYPPGAQLLFALLRLLAGDNLVLARLVMAGVELAAAALVWRLLQERRAAGGGPGPHWLAVWLWHPLALFEIAYSGHLEALVVLLAVAALAAAWRGRTLSAGLLLGMAGLVKLYPLALVPALWQGRWRTGLAAAATMAAGLATLVLDPARGPWTTLRSFLATGGFNSPLANGLNRLLGLALPTDTAALATAAAMAAGLGGVALRVARGARGPARLDHLAARTLTMALAATLLAPTLHPWYLIWLLPLLCLRPSAPALVLTGTAALSYAFYLPLPAAIAPWLLPAEYILPTLVLGLKWWQHLHLTEVRSVGTSSLGPWG